MNKVFENLKAICLCLDRRKEHWVELGKQCKAHGIDFLPFIAGEGNDRSLIYDHIDVINPDVSQWQYGVPHLKHHHYNAMLCHKQMIRNARDRGWTEVLLLEDDAYFCERFNEVLNLLSQDSNYDLILDSADIINLGWWHHPDDHPFNVNVEKGWNSNKEVRLEVINPYKRTGGLHGVIVRESVYDYILNLPLINPIDSQLCDASGHFLSVLVLPKVIHVKSMFSETEGCHFDRAKL